MNHLLDVVRTVLPVLAMLCIGVLCRKKSIITREGIQALKQVVVQIALPAVLLHAFAATSYGLADVLIPLMMFAVCVAGWAMGKLCARAFRLSSFLPFLTTGFEAGMLGYALFQMLYGSEKTAEFARIDLGQVLFVFTLYKVLLSLHGKEKADGKALLREMALSPIILSILAGVILGATGLYQALIPSGISGILDACTDFISAPTGAIILLTIGYDLVLNDIPWKAALQSLGLRLCIMAALCAAFLTLTHLLMPGRVTWEAVVLMFILPPPFVLPVFANDAGQRVYISSVLSVSTLAAMIGFGILAAI